MKIQAILRLKHGAIMSALKERGWSQKDLCDAIGEHSHRVSAICNLQFKNWPSELRVAEKIALELGLPVDTVLPPELKGIKLENRFVKETEINPSRLLHYQNQQRFLIESPVDTLSKEELKEILLRHISTLPKRVQVILNLYYGLNGKKETSLAEIGRQLNRTREAVRQTILRAENQLRRNKLLQRAANELGFSC